MSESSSLKRLQDWYRSHCDGSWEHTSVIRLETMDNPGWYLEIDIYETELADKQFSAEKISSDNGMWHEACVKNGKFIIFGGPSQLEEMIGIFLDWAKDDLGQLDAVEPHFQDHEGWTLVQATDVIGARHSDIPTPHTHLPDGSVRTAAPQEIPNGKK